MKKSLHRLIIIMLSIISVAVIVLVMQSPRLDNTPQAQGLASATFSAQQQAMLEEFATGPPRMVCFAPGTDLAFQAAMDRASHHAMQAAGMQLTSNFVINNRWTKTAKNGNAVGGDGDGLTLTWAVVADGTPISNRGNEPSDLRARLDIIFPGGEARWMPYFQEVFDNWSAVTGVTYIYENGDTDTSDNLVSSNGKAGSIADIRIGGHFIDGDAGVLAENYFPSFGDMIIDTADDYFLNGDRERIFKNIIYHEHGHGLGLDHSFPVDNTKIMEPTLNLSFLGLRHDDIRGGQALYGDIYKNNNSFTNAAVINLVYGNTLTQQTLSIDKSGEADYFIIHSDGSAALRISVSPIGFSYPFGQKEGGPITTIDSIAIANLNISVYANDQTTLLHSSDIWPIGASETAQYVSLPSAGAYYIKIAASAAGSVQLYDLNVSLSAQIHALGVATSDSNLSNADIGLSGAQIQAYDSSVQTYQPSNDAIDSQRGYWVNATPFNPDFSGRPSAVDQIDYALQFGWNLLSIPSTEAFVWDSSMIQIQEAGSSNTQSVHSAAEAHICEDYVWIFDSSSGNYQPVYDSGILSNSSSEISAGQIFWFYSAVHGATLQIEMPMSAITQWALPSAVVDVWSVQTHQLAAQPFSPPIIPAIKRD